MIGRDMRLIGFGLTVVLIAGIGLILALLPPPQPRTLQASASEGSIDIAEDHARQATRAEIKARFDQAVMMLHAGEYDYAVKALHRVLALSPRMPEAHVNMGYALLGLQDYRAAHDFFVSAIDLRPQQHNAYFGLAEALEGMGDLQGALGAMRSYLHLSREDDPYRTKAEAAIWEWNSALQQPKTTTYEQVSTNG